MTIDLVHTMQHRYYRHMQHDEALGFAINQQMFAERLTNVDLGRALGISKSTVSRKVRGHVTWSAEEVSLAAHLFGIPVDALMPTPDGSGGWVPAPYVPAGSTQIRRDPAPYGTGSVVVAGTGFEPATWVASGTPATYTSHPRASASSRPARTATPAGTLPAPR